MARDKVGIVGRNGAGKTSMFKVLGGDNEPAAGKVTRSGMFGYLSQDPRGSTVDDGRSAISHILSGREIDADLERLEKLRIAMEEDASERNVGRYVRAEDAFRMKGGYSADSEARSIAAGLGLKADRLDLPLKVLSGGERRRVELSRILFAGSDMLLLDEPTNHLDIDATTLTCSTRRSPACSTWTVRTRTTRGTSSSTAAPTPSTSAPGQRTRLAWRRRP
jgi:ATPase subunit of ABC transporter with duplicated ATPase domains